MKLLWRIIKNFGIWLPAIIFVWWCYMFDQSPDLTPYCTLEKNIVLYPAPDSTVRPVAEVKKGMRFGRVRTQGEWVSVFTSDNKKGWLPESTLVAAFQKPGNIDLALHEPATLYSESSFSSQRLQELTAGITLKKLGSNGGWIHVSLKDNTTGWIYVLPEPGTIWHIAVNHFIHVFNRLFHNGIFYRIESWLHQKFSAASIQTRGMGFSRILFLAGYALLLMLPYFAAILIQASLARLELLSNFVLRWLGMLLTTVLFLLLYYVTMLLPPANEHMTAVAVTGFIIMLWGLLLPLKMYDSSNRCSSCHKLGTMSLAGYSETGKRHGELVTTESRQGIKRETSREKFTEATTFSTYKCSACGAKAVVGSSYTVSGWK